MLRINKKKAVLMITGLLLFLADIVYCSGTEWIWDSGYKMTFPNESNANILIWLACVLICVWVFSWLPRYKYYNKSVQVTVIITVLISFVWMLITLTGSNTIFTIFVRHYSPFMLVFVAALVIGVDETVYNLAVKISKYIMFLSLVLAIYHEISFLAQYGWTIRSQSSAIHVYYWEGVMSWLFYVFNTEPKKDVAIARTGTILYLVAALLTASRSNILIAFLCTFLYYKRSYEHRQLKIGAYVKIAITVVIGILLFGHFVPEMFQSLLDRLGSDSRSGQYEVFFQQVSLSKLFIGQGVGATYSFSRFENFAYVDNANLVMAFRYGMIPTIGMLLLLVMALVRSYIRKESRSWQIVLVWLLVTNGFSVYLNYKITWGYFLLWITVGHILNNRRMCGRDSIYEEYKV